MKTKEEIKKYKAAYYQKHKEVWERSLKKDPEQVKRNKRNYVLRHPEKRRESVLKYDSTHKEEAKAYYQKNREHIRSRVKANTQKHRQAFLEMYGRKCQCCGESNENFLTLDHINGQKGQSKDRGITSYRKATVEYRPDLYRTYCMNCNFATRFGDPCSHK